MKISHLASTLSLAFAAVATVAAPAAYAENISGAGSTFAYPIYAKWADAYKSKTGVGLNYQSIGSGGGIKQIKAKTVSFGASDMPLTIDELNKADLWQWPQVIGGAIPVVNLKGIKPGELVIDGATLGDIYLGKVTYWDDAEIKALNPGVKLPHTAIAVVHRSDGSGTTFLFSTFLSDTNPAWKDKVGASTAVEWPVGIGAKGNESVANMTLQTDGGIGYVEFAYVVQNKMTFMKMKNRDGKVVSPSAAAFAAAAANADWGKAPGFNLVLDNQPGAESWPITGATFVLVNRRPTDAAAVGEVFKFFDWSLKHGQKLANELDYVPMPANVIKDIEASWTANVKDAAGQPLWK